MPRRSLIGISMDTREAAAVPNVYELADTYTQCILDAGGLPLMS